MSRQISPQRKNVFYIGRALLVMGCLLFVVGFVGFGVLGVMEIGSLGETASRIIGVLAGLVGMALVAIGAIMQVIAARGPAGSSLVMDPEQAREGLEPWSRMAGGMVKDAVDESGLLGDAAGDFDTRLRKLHHLHQDGIISSDEYDKAKARILESQA